METAMSTSYASVHTPHARAYLTGLGKVWHHNPSVTAAMQVVIPFPIGLCAIAATTDLLNITLTARSSYEIALLEDLISDHLDRLSQDESLHYQWVRPADCRPAASHS